MLKPLILRADRGIVSGYKQLIEKTISILQKHFDLIILPVFNDRNSCEDYKKLNKSNWNCPELYLTPISHDGCMSFLGDFTVKNNCFLYSMWEASRLTRFQKNECKPFKKIIVPSNWNKECFEKDKFNVSVLPCFVDEKIYYPRQKKNNSIFSFVAGGSHLINSANHKRKEFDTLLKVFRKVFSDKKDVELRVKLSNCDYEKRPLFLDSKIKYYGYFDSELDYADFLGDCDAFVSVSKSEGWGFMQIESLAVGKPIISPLYSAIKEYANESNTFAVDYVEDLAFGAWGSGGGLWANIKEESLAEQLLNVYNKKDEIRQNYLFYHNSVLPRFSLANYESNLINFLNENYTLYDN